MKETVNIPEPGSIYNTTGFTISEDWKMKQMVK
jgi:hypothetical protein